MEYFHTRLFHLLENAAATWVRPRWHISYTSPSLADTLAAVKAGLGITVLPAHMLPLGIHPIRKETKLPHLADSEVALMKKEELTRVAEIFAEHVVQSLERMA